MEKNNLRILPAIWTQLKTFLESNNVDTTKSGFQSENRGMKQTAFVHIKQLKLWNFYIEIDETNNDFYSVKVFAVNKITGQTTSKLSYNFIFPKVDEDKILISQLVLEEEYRNVLVFMRTVKKSQSKYYCKSVYDESFFWNRMKCFLVYTKDKRNFKKGKNK